MLFGVMRTSGLLERALHLPAQDVEVLRGRGEIADLHVVLGAELEEALEARAGMLRALAFVAVRQQQRRCRSGAATSIPRTR